MKYFCSSLPVYCCVDDFYAFVRWIAACSSLTNEYGCSLDLMSGSSLNGAPPLRARKLGPRAPTVRAAPCPFQQGALTRAGVVTGRDHRWSQRRRTNKSGPQSSRQQQRHCCNMGLRFMRETGPSRTGDMTVTRMPWSPCPVREAAGDRAGHSQPAA